MQAFRYSIAQFRFPHNLSSLLTHIYLMSYTALASLDITSISLPPNTPELRHVGKCYLHCRCHSYRKINIPPLRLGPLVLVSCISTMSEFPVLGSMYRARCGEVGDINVEKFQVVIMRHMCSGQITMYYESWYFQLVKQDSEQHQKH